MPDGGDAAADGGFGISLVTPAPPFQSLLLSKMLSNPLVRALYARLRPGLKAWGAIVKVRMLTHAIAGHSAGHIDQEGRYATTVQSTCCALKILSIFFACSQLSRQDGGLLRIHSRILSISFHCICKNQSRTATHVYPNATDCELY
jgi:hypothetical protein